MSGNQHRCSAVCIKSALPQRELSHIKLKRRDCFIYLIDPVIDNGVLILPYLVIGPGTHKIHGFGQRLNGGIRLAGVGYVSAYAILEVKHRSEPACSVKGSLAVYEIEIVVAPAVLFLDLVHGSRRCRKTGCLPAPTPSY